MSSQNIEVKVNAFLNSVQLLFHSNNKDQKKRANKFLIDLEKNADSWDVAYHVLLKDDLPEEAYFNALQILKNKIKFDFGNYTENPEYIEKLLLFFLSNIDKFKNSPHYLLINYCDCIGKAFLFTGGKFQVILQNFTKKLSDKKNDINCLICLLLIFNFISEASYDTKIVIDKKNREICQKNIINISDDVFQFLIFMINKLNEMQNNDNKLKKFITNQILETFINYISIKFDEKVMLKFNSDYLPIINFIFQINEENLEKHSECICYILQLPLHSDKMRNLAQIIFTKILNFKDIFYKSIESLDTEQTSFYIDVFTSMVENNLDQIFKEKRFDLIQIIVDLTKKSSPIKIDIIIEFFENLNEYIYNQNYTLENVMSIFKNMFIQLIHNIIFLTKFDDEIFVKLNQSKPKALKNDDDYTYAMDFRNSVKEFLEDFVSNYGFNFVFEEILYPEFTKIISNINQNKENMKLWCKLENILYIFSCICKEINVNDNSFNNVITLFYTIFEIPKELSQIIRTIADIIDNCSEILSKDKNLLKKGFELLVNGLENKLTLKYCSISAKSLLHNNIEIMAEFKMTLLKLYNDNLKDKILLNEHYLDIIEGLTEVVTYSKKDENNSNDYDIIKKCVIEIMRPWVVYLKEAKQLVEKNNNISDKDNKNLNILLVILKFTSKSAFDGLSEKNKNIMNEIFNEIWPLIVFILNKMSTKSETVENVIQLIKIYMRGLNNNFVRFIPEYVESIINGYKLMPISSYLYAYEILVTTFSRVDDEKLRTILNNTFNSICQITLNGYIKNEFDSNILVEIGYDFFGMLYRVMSKSPFILLDSQLFGDVINSALNYFNTNQIENIKNILIFFQEILSYENSSTFRDMFKNNKILFEKYKNIIQKQIENFSLPLCEKILKSYEDVPTEGVIENLTELFKDFIFYQKSLAIKCMNLNLKFISNDILTNKEKEEFINLIDKYETREKEFDKFIDNFINRCISKQIRDKGKK